MIQDLEANTPDAIKRQRSSTRIAIRAAITVTPANTSDRDEPPVPGVTGDISAGGCNALLPVPLAVGDIYRLECDRQAIDIPPVFARCVRCRLIRDDAFESGFAFLQTVKMPRAAAENDHRPPAEQPLA